ncbi:hypothetical protein [Pseudomonas oryzihabitans]|uniref:Uncharacterized protein n=1 Tax=Pseudomonas oryzihabitans TaxID=47885 RepID=A0ABX3IV69_9PSED|nr:hypothetical protein [Pseudomonas psychrotolerans]ONN71695.1 hypothetical protein BVL52_08605 [Pseudomonas psychrotolerans]
MSNVFVHPKVASAEQTSELQLESWHLIEKRGAYRVLVPNPKAIAQLAYLSSWQARNGLADKVIEREMQA